MEEERKVEVYFIRHGESTSNVEFKILIESIIGFLSFRNYSFINISIFLCALWRLTFSYQLDSHLSELGKKQASSSSEFLLNEISSKQKIKYVHSGLIRTIETAHLMTKSNQLPFIKLNELNEANQIEHVIKSLVQQRIHSFESWLIKNSKEEVIPTFIIFGHAQYFKYLLNKPDEMRNCDIWKATAHISESVNKIRWSNLTLKCRSPYSYHHPIQVLKEYIFGKSLLQSSSENSVGDEGEKTCRICQLTSSESSERLIRPCLCRGTISYVHVSCLNHWRSTSSQASYQCSICKYQYLIRRTALSSFITSDTGVQLLTAFLLISLLLLGGAFSSVIDYLFNFDLPFSFSSNYLYWSDFWWRKCSSYQLKSSTTSDLLSSIFPASFIWKYYHSFLNKYIPLQSINNIMIIFLCNPISSNFIEFFFSGLILVGSLSLVNMILSQTILLTHYFFYNYQEFQRHQQNIVVFIGWLASVNTVTLSKLGILYGVVVLGKGVYDIVQIYARKVAQSIGETILEPFNN